MIDFDRIFFFSFFIFFFLLQTCDDQDGYYGYWGICQACPMGRYGPPGANDCIHCSPGTYAPNEGQYECNEVKDKEFVNIFGANQTQLCGEYSASGGSGLVTMGVQDPGACDGCFFFNYDCFCIVSTTIDTIKIFILSILHICELFFLFFLSWLLFFFFFYFFLLFLENIQVLLCVQVLYIQKNQKMYVDILFKMYLYLFIFHIFNVHVFTYICTNYY